jgi:hypothetical protein
MPHFDIKVEFLREPLGHLKPFVRNGIHGHRRVTREPFFPGRRTTCLPDWSLSSLIVTPVFVTEVSEVSAVVR